MGTPHASAAMSPSPAVTSATPMRGKGDGSGTQEQKAEERRTQTGENSCSHCSTSLEEAGNQILLPYKEFYESKLANWQICCAFVMQHLRRPGRKFAAVAKIFSPPANTLGIQAA
jgi:hypothetical protein